MQLRPRHTNLPSPSRRAGWAATAALLCWTNAGAAETASQTNMGALMVSCKAGLHLSINGNAAGKCPFEGVLPAGKYEIAISGAEEGITYAGRETAIIDAGKIAKITVKEAAHIDENLTRSVIDLINSYTSPAKSIKLHFPKGPTQQCDETTSKNHVVAISYAGQCSAKINFDLSRKTTSPCSGERFAGYDGSGTFNFGDIAEARANSTYKDLQKYETENYGHSSFLSFYFDKRTPRNSSIVGTYYHSSGERHRGDLIRYRDLQIEILSRRDIAEAKKLAEQINKLSKLCRSHAK